MSIAANPSQIRQARAFLQKRGVKSSDVSPRQFAAAHIETGKSFHDLLNFLSRLLSGGQGQGPAPGVTKNVDQLNPDTAIGDTPLDYATSKGLLN